MNLKSIALCGLGLLVASNAALAAPETAAVKASACAYSGTMPGMIKWSNGKLERLVITLNNSNVQIDGVKGLNHISFVFSVCASSKALLNKFTLRVRPEFFNRNELIFRADNFKNIYPSSGNPVYGYGEFQMQVPASLIVKATSESGDIAAKNISELTVKSGSGSITATQINLLNAYSDSGDIYGQDLGGVWIQKAVSGNVHISNEAGNVEVDSIGSGKLTIQNVKGSLAIHSTGTGESIVTQVDGSATIDRTGLGRVQANNINGNFTVKHNGGGTITYSNIKGTVSVAKPGT